MKRVVVTGIGLLTSIGNNKEDTWNNLINCQSGIKKISHFDTDGLTCEIAGFISHNINDPNYYDRSIHLELKDIKRNDRFIQYGIAAAKMAIEDAGIDSSQIGVKHPEAARIAEEAGLKVVMDRCPKIELFRPFWKPKLNLSI